MSDGKGPWEISRPKSSGLRIRLILWFGLLTLTGLGLWKLDALFPGRTASDADRSYAIQAFVIIAFLSSGLVFARNIRSKEVFRNIAIWTGVLAVLMLGYTFQDDLKNIAMRVRSEVIPGEPLTTSPNEVTLTQSADGHFYVMGEANGARVRFLIDTGASDIVLSPGDATRIGIDVKALNFTRRYQTANGEGLGASSTLGSLSIGPIALSDVPVSINRADMDSSLLGMSFLKQMASFEIRGRQLFLRWR